MLRLGPTEVNVIVFLGTLGKAFKHSNGSRKRSMEEQDCRTQMHSARDSQGVSNITICNHETKHTRTNAHDGQATRRSG